MQALTALAQLDMKTKVTLEILVDVARQLDAMRDSPAIAASVVSQAQALAVHLSRAAEHDGMWPQGCLTSLCADSAYNMSRAAVCAACAILVVVLLAVYRSRAAEHDGM